MASHLLRSIKKYGLEKSNNLILVTSDGRNTSHPIVPFELSTTTLDKVDSLNDLDTIVQAGFLTKDKIEVMGLKVYNSICSKIIFFLKKLFYPILKQKL